MRLIREALDAHFMFLTLSEMGRAAIADTLSPVSYAAGAHILRQGDAADAWFILSEGICQVQVSEASDAAVAMLKQGAVFGELGVLQGQPRNASIIAETEVIAFMITREQYAAIVEIFEGGGGGAGGQAALTSGQAALEDKSTPQKAAAENQSPTGRRGGRRGSLAVSESFRMPRGGISHADAAAAAAAAAGGGGGGGSRSSARRRSLSGPAEVAAALAAHNAKMNPSDVPTSPSLGSKSLHVEAVAEQLCSLMEEALQSTPSGRGSSAEGEEATGWVSSPLIAENHLKMRNALMEARAVRQLSILGWMREPRAALVELLTIDAARRALCKFASSHWIPERPAAGASPEGSFRSGRRQSIPTIAMAPAAAGRRCWRRTEQYAGPADGATAAAHTRRFHAAAQDPRTLTAVGALGRSYSFNLRTNGPEVG